MGAAAADVFTGDDSRQQAAQDDQGKVAAVWTELKEAGHQTAQMFTSNDASGETVAAATTGQAQNMTGKAPQSGTGETPQAPNDAATQRSVKVYTTEGQELGAVATIIFDREDDGVRAIVISKGDAGSGTSNNVDEKLRAALCGDSAQ